ncbi:hypothetical protein NDU88_005835 [Pleurodeles waltl]|uniref:Uncharacterized protein n=1 Tax=Pleurodeles waltl TaxID=8319 RepID=A0AAV7SN23_PLEWA|nr:hypothetical protein NDU88_005835 [Pleurodeles waltl]
MQQYPETLKIRPDRAAARPGPGRRRGRGPGKEPSGPAVVAADPCVQVRRDTTAVGGDGGVLTHRHERCNAQSSTANIQCMSLAERIKLLRACRRALDTAAPQCSTGWVLPLCSLFMLDVIKFAIQR